MHSHPTLATTLATAFELQVRKLGLDKQTYAASKELRRWCERNKNQCYIPEWLLDRWRISADPSPLLAPRPRIHKV